MILHPLGQPGRALRLAVMLVCVLLWVLTAAATPSQLDTPVMLDIPAGPVAQTLPKLSVQAGGLEVIFRPDVVAGVCTQAVRGRLTPRVALERMLEGTPLVVAPDSASGAIAVVLDPDRRPAGDSPSRPNSNTTKQAMHSSLKSKSTRRASTPLLLIASLIFGPPTVAQQVDDGVAPLKDEDEVLVLNPFVVDGSQDRGYAATSTLAGTRLRTNLADVGSAISVLTKELIEDIGGYNNQTVLAYAVNTEVSGPRGNFSGSNVNGAEGHITESDNFSNPNGNTRVRGLNDADNTRDYFLSSIPWDGYNISRVDLQRGPNAILFGLGSPAGVVNATTYKGEFRNRGTLGAMVDEHGTRRFSLDYNRELIDKQLGLRIALLDNDQKFQQEPAFRHDRRAFAALKYAPEMLNRRGMLFEVHANYEHGEINANNPRSIPPEDAITMFWKPISLGGVNKRTFNMFEDIWHNSQEVQQMYDRVTYSTFGPSMALYANAGGVPQYADYQPRRYGALDNMGNVMGSSQASHPGPQTRASDPRGLRPVQQWAAQTSLPWGGVGAYRNDVITDPSIFDFYNRLIDGPNKEEYNDWDAYTVDLSHTFFDGMLGYNLTAYTEEMKSGAWSLLGWEGNAIKLDINERQPLGGANPNVGRPYVSARTGGAAWSSKSDREALRAQLFGGYDFAKRHSGLIPKILGEQRLTAVLSDEGQREDRRNYNLMDWDPATRSHFSESSAFYGPGTNSNISGMAFNYYTGDDLRAASGPQGLRMTNLAMPIVPWQGGVVPYSYWDNTWVGPTDDPSFYAQPWNNPWDPNNVRQAVWTQASNPANYQGWSQDMGQIVTFRSPGVVAGTDISPKDYLTNSASLTESRIKSKVFVYQGTFWNRAVVGIYGFRKDDARRYILQSGYNTKNRLVNPITQSAGVSPDKYNFNNPDATVSDLDVETRNWSVMLHVNRVLPDRDILPFNLRLYYNEGENFQPEAGRVDYFGRTIAPPGGQTEDRSIMISTKDDRFSVRITKYKTQMKNATSTDSRIGNMWALQQSLGFGGNQNYFSAPPGIARGYLLGKLDPVATGYVGSGGDANQLLTVIAPAWMQFEKDIRSQFPEFVNAWFGPNTTFGTGTLTGDIPQANQPVGAVMLEDSVSEGYELELVANPTRNWRLAFNVSKTEAMRDNAPGEAFRSIAEFVDDKFQNTPVGLTPIWWPANVRGVATVGPYPSFFRPDWLRVNALNGQSAGEIRKYRANLITNYSFDTGALKGVGVGAGYRWEDKSVIAYAPIRLENGRVDVNIKNPYYAPAQKNIDLWFSYARPLTREVNWKIQLNLFNVGGKNRLVPVSAGVDPAAVAGIAPASVGPDTPVPMRPTAYSIRYGMNWQLSTSFEF